MGKRDHHHVPRHSAEHRLKRIKTKSGNNAGSSWMGGQSRGLNLCESVGSVPTAEYKSQTKQPTDKNQAGFALYNGIYLGEIVLLLIRVRLNIF